MILSFLSRVSQSNMARRQQHTPHKTNLNVPIPNNDNQKKKRNPDILDRDVFYKNGLRTSRWCRWAMNFHRKSFMLLSTKRRLISLLSYTPTSLQVVRNLTGAVSQCTRTVQVFRFVQSIYRTVLLPVFLSRTVMIAWSGICLWTG